MAFKPYSNWLNLTESNSNLLHILTVKNLKICFCSCIRRNGTGSKDEIEKKKSKFCCQNRIVEPYVIFREA